MDFMRQLRGIISIGTVLLLYVLSYAPYLRAQYGPDQPYFGIGCRNSLAPITIKGFEPVEWLIDHTALRKPLMQWADLWSVEEKTLESSYWRDFRRRWDASLRRKQSNGRK